MLSEEDDAYYEEQIAAQTAETTSLLGDCQKLLVVLCDTYITPKTNLYAHYLGDCMDRWGKYNVCFGAFNRSYSCGKLTAKEAYERINSLRSQIEWLFGQVEHYARARGNISVPVKVMYYSLDYHRGPLKELFEDLELSDDGPLIFPEN